MRNREAPGAERGRLGEALAEAFLRTKKGFRVLSRNWRHPGDRRFELDLVCADGEILVFVEVKARDPAASVPGYFAVDRRKRSAVRRAATAYLRGLPAPPRTFRFDIVEVSLPKDGSAASAAEILHFENILLFSKHFRG
jgi:putative endonuclease